MKTASMKKSIYSLLPLLGLMWASNQRHFKFISSADDPTMDLTELEEISEPARDSNRTYRGFNLFHGDDLQLFLALVREEFNVSGFQNDAIRMHLPGKTPSTDLSLHQTARKTWPHQKNPKHMQVLPHHRCPKAYSNSFVARMM